MTRLLDRRVRRLLGCLGLLLGFASVALAYFTASGAGTAQATVATMTAPSNVTVRQSGADITVTWSTASLSSGGAVEGYRVARSDGANVCGTPTLVTATQCTDSGVPSGTYTYTVTAVYNSWSATGTSAAITVLTAPSLTSTPASTSASSSPSISFSGGGTGVNHECKLDSGSYTACSSPQALTALNGNANLADGSHSFAVRALKGGSTGPTATYGWTIDTSAPTITAKPASTSATASPSFSFTHSASSYTFKCKLDGGSYSTCTSPKSYSSLGSGSHTFTLQALDPDGVAVPTTASYTWTINTSAPTITARPSTPSANTAPSFSFSHTAYTSFKCQLDGGGYSTCTSPASYSGLSNGSHAFQVEALDSSGVATSATSYTWTVDASAPTLTSTPPSLSSSSSASFSFTDSTYSSLKCKLDGASFTTCTSPASYSGLSNASQTFQVEAIDADGVATTAASYTWTVDTNPPQVTSITSQDANGTTGDGKIANGDKLIITFNEDLNAASLPTSIAAGAASESRSATGANVKLNIPGITNGALDTGSTAYLSGTGAATATFGATVTLVNNGASTTVTVTVSNLAGTNPAKSSGALAFSPAPTIKDQLGGSATGTFTTASTFKLF